nr:flagellar basal body P-ring formation chaperone FlgA [Neptunomonas qingdaonensis]
MHPESHINIVVNPINDQVNNKKCYDFSIPLPADIPSGGRLSIRVSCTAPDTWSVYVTARVDILSMVATAKRPILKGASLSARDLHFTQQNISTLNQSYFTKPEQLLTLIARRNIATGTLLTSNLLVIPELINRNDSVIIEATIGTLSVRTQGTALDSGRYGEQIRVINNKSQKVIRAYIKSRGVVSVSR